MKLVGELKKKAQAAENKEKLGEIIKEHGMELNDEELDEVSAGATSPYQKKRGAKEVKNRLFK